MDKLGSRLLLRKFTLYHPTKLTPRIQCNTSQQERSFTSNNSPQKPKGFFAKILDDVKTEFSQNKEIKESLEKFRRETQKLEETEALRQAREKYKKVEAESMKDVNEVLQSAKDTLKSGVDSVKEAEIIKKTFDRARGAAEGISKQGERLKETSAFKAMSEASRSVEKELDNADMISSLYKAPSVLVKRSERSGVDMNRRNVEANQEAQEVELHKDSKWSQNWKQFKEENEYVNKIFELKMRIDESDNPVIRLGRNFVEKITDTVGSLFQTTDLSQVLTDISKVDPNFDMNEFVIECEKFIIPTILESLCQDREDILADWCHEAVFNVLWNPYKEAKKLGWKINTRILDIQNVELAMGKIMEHGPVLVITFNAQQLTYVTNSKGEVVEGDPDKILQNTYVMAFCRDQSDLDPRTAWRLIDVAMSQSQFVF